jgi:protocatechuate 3,4-dioxygenase, beta subunit
LFGPTLTLKSFFMKWILFLLWPVFLASCSDSRSQHHKSSVSSGTGGSCEGCEAIYESPIPFDKLGPVDTLPDFGGKGENIAVEGIIYKRDGKTPAPGVVLYIYHTGQDGKYTAAPGEKGWGKRHGSIRGWIRTDDKGRYRFLTVRPASYPNSSNPQHIHAILKEPGKGEYWIDEYHFDDDPLYADPGSNEAPRGGKGLLHLVNKNGLSTGTRHIILGKNVPGYGTKS